MKKKMFVLMGMLCSVCFMAGPALALNQDSAENRSCQGPSQIEFSRKTFERKHTTSQTAQTPCRASYQIDSLSSYDGYANDWAPYSAFYSQLIAHPRGTVLDTLYDVVPAGAVLQSSHLQDSDDVVLSYRVVEKHARYNIVRFLVFRALKQSDASVRIYRFQISMQANTAADDGTFYATSIPQQAYEHFNTVVQKNQTDWIKSMQSLDTFN